MKVQVRVNERGALRNGRFAFTNKLTLVSELLQNARRAGATQVTIVESSPSACADARENLAANGLAGGEVREEPFGVGPAPAADVFVLDPPRAGLGEVGAAATLAAAPERVLLVACSLESMARDLARLTAAYRVERLRLCDLFPHTEHVEAVALLVRR